MDNVKDTCGEQAQPQTHLHSGSANYRMLDERYLKGQEMNAYLRRLDLVLLSGPSHPKTRERLEIARQHFEIGFMYLTKAIAGTPEEKL